MEWYRSKKDVEAGGVKFMFAKDENSKGAKSFTKVETHDEFLEWANSQIPTDRCFYEMILDKNPVKLFFDIDVSPAIDDEMKDITITSVIERSIFGLREYYNVHNINAEDFAVLDSSGVYNDNDGVQKTKTSLHIILVNKVYFQNYSCLKIFIKKVFANRDKDENIKGIDFGVYRPGCFRMPLSTKRGQNRFLTIITNHSMKECMVTCIDDIDNMQCLEKMIYMSKPKMKVKRSLSINSFASTGSRSEPNIGISENQLTDEELIEECIEKLPEHLATNYETWINTGIKIYLTGAKERMWHLFSMKDPTIYNKEVCHEKWRSFYSCKGSHLSFFALVRSHCPGLMDELKTRSLQNIGTYDNEIALTLSHLYGEDHIFSNGEWYYFNGLQWCLDMDRTMISHKIITDFHKRLNNEIIRVNNFIKSEECTAEMREQEDLRIEIFKKVKFKTQNGCVSRDFHVLSVAFDKPNFVDLLDTNPNLIGFDNGVYDLESGYFREGTRDDYLTRSVGYNYETKEENMVYDKELRSLLKSILPDKKVRKYMLTFLSSCMSGNIHEELIHFWTGLSNKLTGANGKSTLVSLILYTFGDYATIGHSSIITTRRENSQSSNSALMSLKGKRFVAFQEIDNENSINMPVIKGMTGNDLITGRQIYKRQETFIPEWHLVICANTLPPVSSDDGGTKRRVRNIPFESKFVDNPNDPKWKGCENMYKINYNLKDRLKHYRLPFMKILLEYYEVYRRTGIPKCEKVEMHTNQYFKNNSVIDLFISEKIEEDENSILHLTDVSKMRDNNMRNKYRSINDFIQELEERLGPLLETYHDSDNNRTYKKVWVGYRIKNMDEMF